MLSLPVVNEALFSRTRSSVAERLNRRWLVADINDCAANAAHRQRANRALKIIDRLRHGSMSLAARSHVEVGRYNPKKDYRKWVTGSIHWVMMTNNAENPRRVTLNSNFNGLTS